MGDENLNKQTAKILEAAVLVQVPEEFLSKNGEAPICGPINILVEFFFETTMKLSFASNFDIGQVLVSSALVFFFKYFTLPVVVFCGASTTNLTLRFFLFHNGMQNFFHNICERSFARIILTPKCGSAFLILNPV